MKAAQVHKNSGRVVVEEVAVREPGPGEVRVAVEAAAVNPADIMVASGVFWDPSWSVVGDGWDFAGRVDAVGNGVSDLQPGTLVVGIDDVLDGSVRAHAEYVVSPRAKLTPIPERLSLDEAATLPLNTLTAAQALDLLGPADGRRLLVTGAAGAVGGFAVPLAARAGWKVVGYARAGDEEFVRGAGAHEFVSELADAAYDAVLDAAALQDVALSAVADGGAFVGVLPFQPVTAQRGIEVHAVQVAANQEQLVEAVALAADGVLAARIAGVVPFDEIAAAYDKVAGGGSRGRWLLRF